MARNFTYLWHDKSSLVASILSVQHDFLDSASELVLPFGRRIVSASTYMPAVYILTLLSN